jgi:hypothetical protein
MGGRREEHEDVDGRTGERHCPSCDLPSFGALALRASARTSSDERDVRACPPLSRRRRRAASPRSSADGSAGLTLVQIQTAPLSARDRLFRPTRGLARPARHGRIADALLWLARDCPTFWPPRTSARTRPCLTNSVRPRCDLRVVRIGGTRKACGANHQQIGHLAGGLNLCHRLRPLCSMTVPSQSAQNPEFEARRATMMRD